MVWKVKINVTQHKNLNWSRTVKYTCQLQRASLEGTIDCFVDALHTNKRSEEWKNQNNIFTWLSSLRTVWLHFWWKMVTATHNYSSILHWLSYQLSHYIQYNLSIHDDTGYYHSHEKQQQNQALRWWNG